MLNGFTAATSLLTVAYLILVYVDHVPFLQHYSDAIFFSDSSKSHFGFAQLLTKPLLLYSH